MGSYIRLDYYNLIKIILLQGHTYRCVESVFFGGHFEFFEQLGGKTATENFEGLEQLEIRKTSENPIVSRE